MPRRRLVLPMRLGMHRIKYLKRMVVTFALLSSEQASIALNGSERAAPGKECY